MQAFKLTQPTSLDEAIAQLPSEVWDDSVQILAGGQDLLTELKAHLKAPDVLVHLAGLAGLDSIDATADGGLSIGALVTLDALEVEGALPAGFEALSEAAHSIASPQIRSVGTVGGNLNQRPRCWYYRNEAAPCLKKGGSECFAKDGRNKYNAILGGGPSYIVHPSDLAPALIALGAQAVLAGPQGERTLALEDYYILPKEGPIGTETVRRADEILVRVELPAPAAGLRSTYLKFKERGSYDWALASVALAFRLEGGSIAVPQVVLGGVAPKPWRAPAAEKLLAGAELASLDDAAVAQAALEGAEPLSDNAYKVPLAEGLVRRAIRSLNR